MIVIILIGVVTTFTTVFAASDCFQRIGNAPETGYFFSEKLKNRSSKATPLCNRYYVGIWLFDDLPGYRQIPVTGRIFDKDQKAISKEFQIYEFSRLDGWQPSVAPLFDKGFVVTWKQWKTNKKIETKIRARIFETSGLPRCHSFDVSHSTGSHARPVVRGLPNGAFVVLWNRFKVGTYLKIFDRYGKPKTNEILVATDRDVPLGDPYCGQNSHVYVTDSGTINIFMSCQSRAFEKDNNFKFARSFDSNGKPLTNKLTDNQLTNLEGYKILAERYVKDNDPALKKPERVGATH